MWYLKSKKKSSEMLEKMRKINTSLEFLCCIYVLFIYSMHHAKLKCLLKKKIIEICLISLKCHSCWWQITNFEFSNSQSKVLLKYLIKITEWSASTLKLIIYFIYEFIYESGSRIKQLCCWQLKLFFEYLSNILVSTQYTCEHSLLSHFWYYLKSNCPWKVSFESSCII